ncbi:MAG: hypothetical protein DSZ31_03425 [Gammaproteobacteria bacterium]|nr:MAG: hypothetical protein DSZ31_03425 [Gammaproteobacteria bacterium]
MVASLLSLSRFIFAFLIFYEILYQENYYFASFLIILASLSDFLDGFVARHFERETPVGAQLDHISDKVFVLLVLVAFFSKSRVEPIQLSLIAFREIGITFLRFYGFAGPVNVLGKLKTVTEFLALFLLCFHPLLGNLFLWFAIFLAYISAFFYLRRPVKVQF